MLEMTNSVRQETEVLEKERQALLAKVAKVFVIVTPEKINPNKIMLMCNLTKTTKQLTPAFMHINFYIFFLATAL